ncbi:MAG: hypothetical protein F4038_05605 [Chloroflexi bacterium]|nr:hypothetical protein [Chloroflexota bacterium]MYD54318.1 hypothetical protein [Chloroflexota bacterium]MYJ92507.1 hypothetical protein [Chloroflexota bacterium]
MNHCLRSTFLVMLFSALFLAACSGGDDVAQETGTQTAAPQEVESAEAQARVQVIRDRASLGDPNAPVVIQEYSDFL